ncbi:signal recognition particle-docking protein FtsY [Liquorilactobacillus sicerae]|uniref:signal recognition particle-docking protein FtsY n=1 Tax=Liquorilactobacillus sicerae TaxID=1416943 RepID=UPI00248114DE|nr:signal recognition particle-docking protein FtsY [Liquorilactobacillus sicerae]
MGFFEKIKQAFSGDQQPKEDAETQKYDQSLEKSRNTFGAKLNSLLANFRSVDEDFFDDLEETLIEADVGFETAVKISDELKQEVKLKNAKTTQEVAETIIQKLINLYEQEGQGEDNQLHYAQAGPTIFLFVGVNGVGKTTTIGKLAFRLKKEGKKVLLAAGDTFRAGAIEQLAEWGKKVGVSVVQKPAKSDPAAVVYDAVKKAQKENYDVLLVDTAGRLQNKVNLMRELAKISRVITREIPAAPQEVLLALDATTGQNALSQAKQFKATTPLTGIILTKLDGTARGGIVLAIRNELHLPVKLVGLGEKMNDLQDFDPEKFAAGLFGQLLAKNYDA